MGYPSMPEEGERLQPAAPSGDITLPGPHLDVSAVPDTLFPIRHTDWQQLRRKIASLSDPTPDLANLGWACVSVAAAAVIAFFPWVGADSQLPIKVQERYAYISPLLGILAVASIVVALFSFFVNSRMATIRAASVQNVLADMDAIRKPDEVADAQAPPPSNPGKLPGR